jgi:uncharacterized protein YkwD
MRLGQLRRAAIAAVLALAVAAPAPLGQPPVAAAWDPDSFEPSAEIELVGLTNRSRVAAGLPPLALDDRLAAIARWRSRDMVERTYFSHEILGGGTVFDELSRRDYCFRLAGENIGWNTWDDPDATRGIHEMFLESPGHRRNVVGAAWDSVGVGAFKGADGRKVWTVLFADACERTTVARWAPVRPIPAAPDAGWVGSVVLDLLNRLLALGTGGVAAR